MLTLTRATNSGEVAPRVPVAGVCVALAGVVIAASARVGCGAFSSG
jgi:hypothetical protein